MVIFVIVGLAIGITAGEFKDHSQVLMVAFFAWVAIGSLVLMQIRCPRCGTPVVYQGKLGKISLYAGFVRRQCQHCGEDLTKKA
jgi:hypothetical protein